MARLYQPLWERLKTEKRVQIKADPKAFKRIRKAVTKEKDQDLAWKVENENCYMVIRTESDLTTGVITFELLPAANKLPRLTAKDL